MNNTVLKIALAGLMHDVGKFAERAFAVDGGDKDSVQQDYRYGHACSTEQVLKEIFPIILESRLKTRLNLTDVTVLNLAARHHKPRHIYEIMIREADWIASGHERAKADEDSSYSTEGRERKSQVPLLSILGRVYIKGREIKKSSRNMRYRIMTPLAGPEHFESLYPVPDEDYSAMHVRQDYKKHWGEFVDEIRGLDPFRQFDTLFEICRAYQWCLPASTRKEEMEDVSLFEHQKATAAIASCLFYLHEKSGNLEEQAIRNRAEQKYLLFCGDISGIQKFIYQISSKGAYKTLKGRSFFVQLLAEVLARRFVEEFDMTVANIMYASGGKFYLLLPNTSEIQGRLSTLAEEINRELFKQFNGDLFVRTGFEPLSGADLTCEGDRNLSRVWDELGHSVLYSDRKRYAATTRNHYEEIFGVKAYESSVACEVCHRSLRSQAVDKRSCPACTKMKEIGRLLGKSVAVVMSDDKTAIDGRYNLSVLNKYFWFIPEEHPDLRPHKDCHVWVLDDSSFSRLAKGSALSTVNAGPIAVGGTHRFDSEFDEIAGQSNGIKRLGILRMDVDNLGDIFAHGLKQFQYKGASSPGRFHSLGRITTLSWQLSLFFGAMVPSIIKANKDWRDRVTVVYSGGDDLFLLGAWDAVPDVALAIRDHFARFSCNNPAWTLSGGMVMTGGKFPVYKSAEMAGDAEENAKNHRIHIQGKVSKKDAFTFLDTPMKWGEFSRVSTMRSHLISILQGKENRPLLGRMRDIASSWENSRERMIRNSRETTLTRIQRDLMAEKWRWRMVYSLKRFAERRKSLEDDIKSLQRFVLDPVADTDRRGIELLGVLSRWCEFELRSNKD